MLVIGWAGAKSTAFTAKEPTSKILYNSVAPFGGAPGRIAQWLDKSVEQAMVEWEEEEK